MTAARVVHEFATFGSWHGQVNDLDSHLETPFSRWGELLGEPWGLAAQAFSPVGQYDSPRAVSFGTDAFWEVKDSGAPGMFDLADRVRILDAVGIRRQLVFPALMMLSRLWADAPGRADRLRSYNDFAGRWTTESGGRVRVAATVAGGMEEVLSQAEAALAAGARALLIQDGSTIERHSPAGPQMDPLWAMLARSNACALLHIGGSDAFMSNDWKLTDALNVDPASSNLGDRLAGPHNIGTMHLSPSNYLTCLVFGGVFDRHPALRFGVIEYGAMWAAPLLDLLTNRRLQSARVARLERTPRQVFSENLRFTPFGFEPIGRQIERYGLPEMYGFSTDFPHPEGGHNPHELLHTDLAPLGTRTIEQVFVSNADLLVPD